MVKPRTPEQMKEDFLKDGKIACKRGEKWSTVYDMYELLIQDKLQSEFKKSDIQDYAVFEYEYLRKLESAVHKKLSFFLNSSKGTKIFRDISEKYSNHVSSNKDDYEKKIQERHYDFLDDTSIKSFVNLLRVLKPNCSEMAELIFRIYYGIDMFKEV